MNFMKRMLSTRKGEAAFYAIGSVLYSVVLGGLCSLITGNFFEACKGIYFMFGAPLTVCAALVLFTKIKNHILGFSYGLYYGTIFIAFFMQKFGLGVPTKSSYIIGLIISSLLCYIVYLRDKRN